MCNFLYAFTKVWNRRVKKRGARHNEYIRKWKDKYWCYKCQDEVCGGKQQWSHIEIQDIAEKELFLYAKDLFILVNTSRPKPLYQQKHARKNHSYLWIFEVRW